MPNFLTPSVIQLMIGVAILAVLIAVAAYVLTKLRARPLQQERTAHEQLAYFRELQSQGKLSTEEYRKIKERLSAQIVEEADGEDESLKL